MKPAMLTSLEDPNYRFIVDEDSASILDQSRTGKSRIHYETAILIKDLKPGEMRWRSEFFDDLFGVTRIAHFDELMVASIYPAACVLAPLNIKDFHKQPFVSEAAIKKLVNIEDRATDFYLPAVVALLEPATSQLNVKTDRPTASFSFNKSRIENVTVPWETWKFLTAWLWSAWRKREINSSKRITLHQRWMEIVEMGYPHGQKAFEKMHQSLFPKPPR
jgi:hypothetical protein